MQLACQGLVKLKSGNDKSNSISFHANPIYNYMNIRVWGLGGSQGIIKNKTYQGGCIYRYPHSVMITTFLKSTMENIDKSQSYLQDLQELQKRRLALGLGPRLRPAPGPWLWLLLVQFLRILRLGQGIWHIHLRPDLTSLNSFCAGFHEDADQIWI